MQQTTVLPARSVSIEIYSAIAWFTCDSTDFFLSKSVLSRLKSIVFSSRVKSHFIQVVDLSRLGEVPSRSRVRLNETGDSQVYLWYTTQAVVDNV